MMEALPYIIDRTGSVIGPYAVQARYSSIRISVTKFNSVNFDFFKYLHVYLPKVGRLFIWSLPIFFFSKQTLTRLLIGTRSEKKRAIDVVFISVVIGIDSRIAIHDLFEFLDCVLMTLKHTAETDV